MLKSEFMNIKIFKEEQKLIILFTFVPVSRIQKEQQQNVTLSRFKLFLQLQFLVTF